MKIKLDLHIKQHFIKMAELTGEVEVKVLSERFMGGSIESLLVDFFKEKGFKGKMIIDDRTINI